MSSVEPATILALFATGIAGGIVSYLVSLASLVTYPVLLALGLPPVSANVTNTVALIFNSVGAGVGARVELTGQRPLLLRLSLVAAAGGSTGAVLLLVLPDRWFELVAPVLIAASALLIMAQPRLQRIARLRPRGMTPATVAAYFAAAIYIGYFGAAGGLLSIVCLATIIDRPLIEVNAAKAMLSGVANGAAAIGFAFLAPVRWSVVVPLAVGLFLGGLIGPRIARRLPAQVLRGLISVCGLGIAALLACRTYAV